MENQTRGRELSEHPSTAVGEAAAQFCSNFHLPHGPPRLAAPSPGVRYEMQTERKPPGAAELVRMSHTSRWHGAHATQRLCPDGPQLRRKGPRPGARGAERAGGRRGPVTVGRAMWVLSLTAGATLMGETQGISQGRGGGESEMGPAHSPAHTGQGPPGLWPSGTGGRGAWGPTQIHSHRAGRPLLCQQPGKAANVGKDRTRLRCERASRRPAETCTRARQHTTTCYMHVHTHTHRPHADMRQAHIYT